MFDWYKSPDIRGTDHILKHYSHLKNILNYDLYQTRFLVLNLKNTICYNNDYVFPYFSFYQMLHYDLEIKLVHIAITIHVAVLHASDYFRNTEWKSVKVLQSSRLLPILPFSNSPNLCYISTVSKPLYFSPPHLPVCVCMCVWLHTMFRAEQPMALGLSRILFILLLILKN